MIKKIYICDYCGEEIKDVQYDLKINSDTFYGKEKYESQEEYEIFSFALFLSRQKEKHFHKTCEEKWSSEMLPKWRKEYEQMQKIKRLKELKEIAFKEYLVSKGLTNHEKIKEYLESNGFKNQESLMEYLEHNISNDLESTTEDKT